MAQEETADDQPEEEAEAKKARKSGPEESAPEPMEMNTEQNGSSSTSSPSYAQLPPSNQPSQSSPPVSTSVDQEDPRHKSMRLQALVKEGPTDGGEMVRKKGVHVAEI